MQTSQPGPSFHPLRPWPDGEDGNPGGKKPNSRIPKKRVVVSQACKLCRKVKAKCSGTRPRCHRCERVNAECEYNTTNVGETRTEANKRRLNELSLHEELVQILRTREESTVGSVIQRLRAGQDVGALVRLVHDGDLLLQCSLNSQGFFTYTFPFFRDMPQHLYSASNPYLSSLLHYRTITRSPSPTQQGDGPWRVYDIPYHAAVLVEPRIDRVRSLLRTYFKSEFPYNCFFHVDSFLDDLASGRERYCSSLLVNAILANACHGQQELPDRSSFWKPHTLGYQFLAEAKRLWELERNSRKRITTLQAGAIICISCNIDGIDKIGASYLAQCIAMGVDMGLFTQTFASKSSRQCTVYAMTAWSLFAWQAMQQFHFYLEPLLSEPPTIELPTDLGEIFVMYPHAGSPWPVQHSSVFRAIIGFRKIMNEVGIRNFGSGKDQGPLNLDEAMSYRAKLLEWMQYLPTSLSPSQIVLPTHLKIHIHLYNLMMNLFEPLVGSDYGGNIPSPSPEEIVIWSRACMESVVRLYYTRHSFEHLNTIMVTYLLFVGFNALKMLGTANPQDHDAVLSTAVLCAKGLRDQSRFYYIAEAIFMVLRDSMDPSAAHLLKDFAHIEDEEDRKQLVARQVRSAYPVNIVSIADDPEKQRLSRLVEAYTGLGLDSGAEAASERSDME
ncbi:Zn(2)-C6 fungal-type domain-containing protein [Fusarium sp. LHS14.1]|nr:Zn(2)-C6 fungal-type domain-containing protein [Fusarium sp. LHS14.1]